MWKTRNTRTPEQIIIENRRINTPDTHMYDHSPNIPYTHMYDHSPNTPYTHMYDHSPNTPYTHMYDHSPNTPDTHMYDHSLPYLGTNSSLFKLILFYQTWILIILKFYKRNFQQICLSNQPIVGTTLLNL